MIRKLRRLIRSLRGTKGLVDDLPSTEALHLRLIPVKGDQRGPALYSSPRGEVRSPVQEPKP